MTPAPEENEPYAVPLDDGTLERLRRLAADAGLSPEALAQQAVAEKLDAWQSGRIVGVRESQESEVKR